MDGSPLPEATIYLPSLMTESLAILEVGDDAIIAAIVFVAASVATLVTRQQINLNRVERKLDALLKQQGVSLPSGLSPEVQRIAMDPSEKIAAIKLHREQNPGLSLAEAKKEIEEFVGR